MSEDTAQPTTALDAVPPGVNEIATGRVLLRWSRPGIGFGTIEFGVRDGKPFIDTETMGKEFALEVITEALSDAFDAEQKRQDEWWLEQAAKREPNV